MDVNTMRRARASAGILEFNTVMPDLSLKKMNYKTGIKTGSFGLINPFGSIYVKAGKGGNGAVAWRREKYEPSGGPYGGDGGKGGSVILVADEGIRTLMDYRYKRSYYGQNGEDGRTKKQYGKDGEDVGGVLVDAFGDAPCLSLWKLEGRPAAGLVGLLVGAEFHVHHLGETRLGAVKHDEFSALLQKGLQGL